MDKIENLKMIEDLSNVYGISGFEDDVLTVIKKYSKNLGSFSEDSLRNLYLKRNTKDDDLLTISINAHSDEVGFMVQFIRDDGMIEFMQIGGWIINNVPSQLVKIKNSEGLYISGVVASKPPHFMSLKEREASLSFCDLVIDVGATSKDEVVNDFKIEVGSPIVPEANFTYDENHDIMRGKAFDCRVGCAAVISTFNQLKNEKIPFNLVGDFSSQEEVGCRGAVLAANTTKPDLCIVFEGCPADDTVVESYKVQTALKKGPMIRHIDARMITNPRFMRYALNIAKENNIPCQRAVRSGGATNASAYHLSNEGVPSIVIGIPVRYAHTHYGLSSYSDYEMAVRLCSLIIKNITKEQILNF